MQAKKKFCSGCEQDCYIYKCDGRKKYCKESWFRLHPPSTPKQRTKIKPVSDKKKNQDTEYARKRKAVLAAFPQCQVQLPGCTIEATDIHHLYSGRNRSKYYLVVSTWKTICRNCHCTIHDKLSAEEAIELGLKLTE